MSRTATRITLVCYDISSDKLRRKIDSCMKDFGIRLQYSIFLCRLDAEEVLRCRESIQKVLTKYGNEKVPNDSLIVFERLSACEASCLLGSRIEHEPSDFEIF